MGCIHIDQDITITGKNSGMFKVNFAIPVNLYETLKSNSETSEEDALSRYFNPKSGRVAYSEMNGLRLKQYRVYQRGDNLNVLIEGEILDLQKGVPFKKSWEILRFQ